MPSISVFAAGSWSAKARRTGRDAKPACDHEVELLQSRVVEPNSASSIDSCGPSVGQRVQTGRLRTMPRYQRTRSGRNAVRRRGCGVLQQPLLENRQADLVQVCTGATAASRSSKAPMRIQRNSRQLWQLSNHEERKRVAEFVRVSSAIALAMRRSSSAVRECLREWSGSFGRSDRAARAFQNPVLPSSTTAAQGVLTRARCSIRTSAPLLFRFNGERYEFSEKP